MPANRGDPTRQRYPGFNGKLLFDVYRGQTRVRAWPRKRGPGGTKRQLQWRQWFREANLRAKHAAPQQQYLAMKMAKGTGKYPRDILLQAMSTGFFDVYDDDGTLITHRWPFLDPIVFQGATLFLPSNLLLTGGVVNYPTWSLPEIDTAQWWSASDPTVLTIPDQVEVVSFSAGFRDTATTGGQCVLYVQKRGTPDVNVATIGSSPLYRATLTTPPINVVPGERYSMGVFTSSGRTLAAGSETSFSVTALQIGT